MKHLMKLMRPHHYIKNFLLFAPLVCSGQLFVWQKLLACIWGFIAFSMASSIVYIINDICDVEKDRNHPTKCSRPIASGKVSIANAVILACVLVVTAVFCQLQVFSWASAGLLASYLLLNLAYSFGLKHIPILDVTILVSGFLIRVLYGGVITEIVISSWLHLTVIGLAFYFSLGKRRNEYRQMKNSTTRKVLEGYSAAFLDKSMNMCLTLALTFYALWSMDESTVVNYGTNLVLTVPIAMLIVMKYNLTIEGDSDGDPVEVLLHDKVLLLLCLVFAAILFLTLYF